MVHRTGGGLKSVNKTSATAGRNYFVSVGAIGYNYRRCFLWNFVTRDILLLWPKN